MQNSIRFKKKLDHIHTIILKSIISIDQIKSKEIFSNSEINVAYNTLSQLNHDISNIYSYYTQDFNRGIDELQKILNKLSSVLSCIGTKSISDILYIVFGSQFLTKYMEQPKASLMEQYVIPINFKIKSWKYGDEKGFLKEKCCDKIVDHTLNAELSHDSDCFEPNHFYSSFQVSVHGIRIIIHNIQECKTIILHGLVENIPIHFLSDHPFIINKIEDIKTVFENSSEKITKTFTLKDLLIYSPRDFYKKIQTIADDISYVKTAPIQSIIKKFMDMSSISQRKMLINLFLCEKTTIKDNEVHYIGYMLYDLIGTTTSANSYNDTIDNKDQKEIYNSFPWTIRESFKDSMLNTLQFSQLSLSGGGTSSNSQPKISLEQQVLLLRSSDFVREKAIEKLKDLKGKSDDQSSKTRQYLEGLVKIPFGVYKKEPVLQKVENIRSMFLNLDLDLDLDTTVSCRKGMKPTIYEIRGNLGQISVQIDKEYLKWIESILSAMDKPNLIHIIKHVQLQLQNVNNNGITIQSIKYPKLASKKSVILDFIINAISKDDQIQKSVIQTFLKTPCGGVTSDKKRWIDKIHHEIRDLDASMKSIRQHLDDSIYGHNDAKSQILKIVAQWINGEQNGYCFGFEGSPGIGKTSLAKRGLAKCLCDETGVSRPFAFIALGGSSNGSTLEGHNYTYMNSTWGKIVDVLMDSKCMNPIIYIDELDKVSKTEQGREIIGILTHLIDTTQNDEFQDRYFSGIPIDLSKVLFIFSYNDPEQIDRILLDRIHRIKFDNLSTKEKIVIVKQHLLPDMNARMGFENVVEIGDDIIEYIIENYTMEPGVRKLKEILFDLYGEINLYLLQGQNDGFGDKDDTSSVSMSIPLTIRIQDLGKKYLKKYRKTQHKMIHKEPAVGIINGMWANALGRGGIISIECVFFPASAFLDLRLTGLQGDVMKESMNVAKSVAWTLTEAPKQLELIDKYKNQGLHVHCPEGSVNKDGPSAGAAITLAIYSTLNKVKINNNYAITGEIDLQGNITAIGGLASKILGSLKAGVKRFLYPGSNQSDFDEFREKYPDIFLDKDIEFFSVNHIRDTIPHFIME